MHTNNKAQAILLAEKLGPGWTVYRVYGTRLFKLCQTALEHTQGAAISEIVHRTVPVEPLPPVVYNRGSRDEREDE